jgi:hypothetical protein
VRENWHFPYAPPEVAREAPPSISAAGGGAAGAEHIQI